MYTDTENIFTIAYIINTCVYICINIYVILIKLPMSVVLFPLPQI